MTKLLDGSAALQMTNNTIVMVVPTYIYRYTYLTNLSMNVCMNKFCTVYPRKGWSKSLINSYPVSKFGDPHLGKKWHDTSTSNPNSPNFWRVLIKGAVPKSKVVKVVKL